MHCSVAIPIDAVAWSVPKIFKFGSKKNPALVAFQRECYAAIRNNTPKTFRRFDGVVRLDIVVVMPRPARLQRRKDDDGFVWHNKRPDRDNFAKAVQDSLVLPLDGFEPLLADDSLVVVGETAKVYAEKSRPTESCVLVVLETLTTTPADELERMGVLDILRNR